VSTFRLADQDIRWSGTDDTTPPGCCLATGKDSLGSIRVWLFRGSEPSDSGYLGSLLIPPLKDVFDGARASAYGPTGAWVTSRGDHAAMLARLADRGAP
jgi:hypothetical protein